MSWMDDHGASACYLNGDTLRTKNECCHWSVVAQSFSFQQWHTQTSVSGGAQLPSFLPFCSPLPLHFPLPSLPSHYLSLPWGPIF